MQRWKRGSQAMVMVNAIFAGLSGAFVAVMISNTTKCLWIQISITLGFVSFILFALAAERITDALDEDKVNIYLYSMLIYDIAVVLLFLSAAIFLFYHCWYLPSTILILGTGYPWLSDILWFVFSSTQKKNDYIEEICKEG